MLFERLVKEPKSTAIIFGTETTIEAGDAPELLIEKGLIPVGLCLKRVKLQVRSKRMRRRMVGRYRCHLFVSDRSKANRRMTRSLPDSLYALRLISQGIRESLRIRYRRCRNH